MFCLMTVLFCYVERLLYKSGHSLSFELCHVYSMRFYQGLIDSFSIGVYKPLVLYKGTLYVTVY